MLEERNAKLRKPKSFILDSKSLPDLIFIIREGDIEFIMLLSEKTKKTKTHPQFAQEIDTISSKCVHYKNLKCSPEQRQSVSLPVRLTVT